MHKGRAEAYELITTVAGQVDALATNVDVVIAPPFPFLEMAVEHTRGTRLIIAAQNCHEADQGAYTGEVSVTMLESLGIGACIVGHSERRQYFGETDAVVGKKIMALLKQGITPIYCCGEVRAEREAGKHFEVVGRQMREALGALDPAALVGLVVAYEPVWAIGTGLTATAAQAQEMHAFIRKELRALAGDIAGAVPILYGGSCKPDNAESLFSNGDVNGGLIGGASLVAEQFVELVRIAGRVKA